MSIFSKLFGFVKKALPIAAAFIPGLGPIAAAAGRISAVSSAVRGAVGRGASARVMPGVGAVATPPIFGGGKPAPPFAQPISRGRRFTTTRPPGRVIQGQLPQLSTVRTTNMSMFGAIGGLARVAGPVVGRVGRILSSRGALAGSVGALAVTQVGGPPDESGRCPVGFHLNKQEGVGGPARTYCVRNRRMNVGNSRAARRSVRRLKGAHKLLKDIEKMMPTRRAARRAAHAPHLPAPHTH